ncbi:nitrilase family protein [Flavobacterium sp. 140616W15]|uniref:nitrilase family protein n=1 Tax=Flavobacterium sp. 140616W15 TaxID=2478552 RepID=UPI000F0C549D|nr:nitrilase family protein [Flavobacterium sp. 140616W15]AYN06083.1 nitrilase family protein [Flavobacterium sp. 140616W15]
MKIALIQSVLHWESPERNRNHFEQIINGIKEAVDLIVMPEMFSTGFTMNPSQVAETMQGKTVLWMRSLAKAKKTAITGSLVIEENGNFYNRLLFVFPSGELQHYDKRHLFTLAGEDKVYTKGTRKLIVDYLGWEICPLICYDLRFPVFSRNAESYDLVLYVANWPKIRTNAWDTLLKARAIENVCYSIGVNRVGLDNHQFEHNGHSQAIDFLGEYLIKPQEVEGVFIVELDKEKMNETRKKLAFLNDKDSFTIEGL